MLCEMCGKKDATVNAIVEGSPLAVCQSCGVFGKIVGRVRQEHFESPKKKSVSEEALPSEMIVEDFAKKIKSARERLGKNQEEFAQFIREKVSVLRKMETGELKPVLETAQKLERLLKIKLIEKTDDAKIVLPAKEKRSNEGFTIGDFIKIKTKNA